MASDWWILELLLAKFPVILQQKRFSFSLLHHLGNIYLMIFILQRAYPCRVRDFTCHLTIAIVMQPFIFLRVLFFFARALIGEKIDCED